jgi:hypothetical protein
MPGNLLAVRALKAVLMCDHDDGFEGFDWYDIALIGALSESLTEENGNVNG